MDDWDRAEAELLRNEALNAALEARQPRVELAAMLVRLRTGHGWTQRELAERAGMTQPEIARIEAMDIVPTWDTVYRLLGALAAGVSISARNEDGRAIRVRFAPAPVPRRARSAKAG